MTTVSDLSPADIGTRISIGNDSGILHSYEQWLPNYAIRMAYKVVLLDRSNPMVFIVPVDTPIIRSTT